MGIFSHRRAKPSLCLIFPVRLVLVRWALSSSLPASQLMPRAQPWGLSFTLLVPPPSKPWAGFCWACLCGPLSLPSAPHQPQCDPALTVLRGLVVCVTQDFHRKPTGPAGSQDPEGLSQPSSPPSSLFPPLVLEDTGIPSFAEPAQCRAHTCLLTSAHPSFLLHPHSACASWEMSCRWASCSAPLPRLFRSRHLSVQSPLSSAVDSCPARVAQWLSINL
uniref:Secreted protein n=1 Tax=Myotis myotis TaxID=51298 RepID=A0A7J7WVL6_MYOMY|nr:hypothetical protein mMyoMyo1_011868 [Myotis myotis]